MIERHEPVRGAASSAPTLLPTTPVAPTFRWALVALALLLILGGAMPVVAQRSEEAKALSKRLMCTCGCNQILGECNHIGCTRSLEMIRKLDQRVARAEPADLILQSFVQEYGAQSLAEPPARGFTGLIWVLAIVVPLGGLALVVWLVRRWHAAAPQPASADGPRIPAEMLARARRQADAETEE